MSYVAFELFKHQIVKVIVKEFLRRGLDKTYAVEIAEWKKYIDQKKFGIKLEKQMKKEVARFRKEIKGWSTTELEEFVIVGLDCLQ